MTFIASFFKTPCWIFVMLMALGLGGCGVQSIPRQYNEVDAAWAEVMNQYQRRADLIPNLVEVVKGYAKHERETLEAVVQARASATQMKVELKDLNEETLQRFQAVQGQLQSALARLMVTVERYPDLKANQNFRDLQVQLEGTENRITIARQRYIEMIKEFNNLVTIFPTNLTNFLFFHHQPKPQFLPDNPDAVQKTPEVKF